MRRCLRNRKSTFCGLSVAVFVCYLSICYGHIYVHMYNHIMFQQLFVQCCLYKVITGNALHRVNRVSYQFLNGHTMFHFCFIKSMHLKQIICSVYVQVSLIYVCILGEGYLPTCMLK